MTKETTNAKTEKVSHSNKTGRPLKVLTKTEWNTVEKLCELQCTLIEIASCLGIHSETLSRCIKDKYDLSFPLYFAQKRTGGKIALRRAQFKAATTGNNTALMIWLGKQYLEQTDQQNITADVKLNGFEVIADQDEDLSE